VSPAQPPSVSRCAPRSRSPVSLIVLTRVQDPARAGGDPVSPTPCLVLFIESSSSSLCLWCCFSRASLGLARVPASFTYELVCHVAACVWVSMFAIFGFWIFYDSLFIYLFMQIERDVGASAAPPAFGVCRLGWSLVGRQLAKGARSSERPARGRTVACKPPHAEVRARGRPEPERARPRSCSTW